MADQLLITQPVYGLAVAAQGTPDMTVAVAAGAILAANVPVAVTAGNVTITAADATQDRIDAVVVNSSGVKSAIAGSIADGANVQAPDTTGYALLAYVYVFNQAHSSYTGTIVSGAITDERNFVALGGFPFLYGSGADGAVHVNANPFTLVDPLDATKNLITANVLQRDMACSSLTIDAGCVLTLGTVGSNITTPVIFCSGLVSNSGTIQTPTATTSGAATSNFGGGGAIQAGSTGAGTAATTTLMGGGGGAGGASGATSGGAASTRKSATATLFSQAGLTSLVYLTTLGKGSSFIGGAAGGAGAGDGTHNGGKGGHGGGMVLIVAQIIDNTSGTITAPGGDGTNGAAATAGGGGGGGGGCVYLVGHVILPGTTSTPAGAHGNGLGTGSNGTDGQAGTTQQMIVTL